MPSDPKKIVIGPQPGPQTKFLQSPADIVIFGGAAGGGKSFALLLDAMRHCVGDDAKPDFNAVLLRQSFQQIQQSGGLLSASEKIYPHLGANFTMNRMAWKFPSKATVSFGHMEHEKDKLKYQGAEIPWIGFDELTHFSKGQFFYMLSRNRSTCGVPSQIRASCNPDSASWVAEFIEWWIDKNTGLPIPERDGVIRYFVRVDDNIEWGDTPQELWDRVGSSFDGTHEFFPKSVTFIRSQLADNQILMEADPSYKASLRALPTTERLQLLEGNWLVSPSEGSEWEDCPHYFDRHIWTEHWPESFAASAIYIDPSKGKTNRSDFSAIVFVGLTGGKMYVKSDIARRPAEQIVEDAVRMYLELKPTAMAIEENNFQDLLQPMFDTLAERMNLPPFQIFPVYSMEKKEIRIRSLGPLLDRKKLLLHKECNGNTILYQQLKDFGIKGRHDDGPDALEGAIRVLRALGAETEGEVTDPLPEDDMEPDVEYAL